MVHEGLTLSPEIVKGSFRDPSGFVFTLDSEIYRQVNVVYRDEYDRLMNGGLYRELVQSELLVPHEEIRGPLGCREPGYKVLRPKQVPLISYPYEWCFSQLKHAALLTLQIQRRALDFGMSLKDASAFNIQFDEGRPVLIDTLSFEAYREGRPWVAYRQFCQHFLGPLALISRCDVRLGRLFRTFVEGIPLDLSSRLLPYGTWFNFALLSHIHLHAKTINLFSALQPSESPKSPRAMSYRTLRTLIDHLEKSISDLRWNPRGTEWADYYRETNYTAEGLAHKMSFVQSSLDAIKPATVWDFGANIGVFSRLAVRSGCRTVALDSDPGAVEKNYQTVVENRERMILPLLFDLTNPSPNLGWAAEERMSLIRRGPVELAMALALVHHLAIANNVPLGRIAEFFNRICRWLIIEFVPKADSQVQRMLASREDIFTSYDVENFERAFERFFTIEHKQRIKGSGRVLYRLRAIAA